jgi:hypothetical protein
LPFQRIRTTKTTLSPSSAASTHPEINIEARHMAHEVVAVNL